MIGGAAFSEEDIFSKMYRDSSVFPHYIRENAELNIEIGRRLPAGDLLAAISTQIDRALEAMARRPIFDFEVRRIRTAEQILQSAMRRALEKAEGATADEVVYDIAGGATDGNTLGASVADNTYIIQSHRPTGIVRFVTTVITTVPADACI